jgi:tetratricopeptide (TPR) repeat protein
MRKIEKACDDLQNEIIKVMKSLGIDDIGFVPSYLPAIITNRCLARFDCAKNIGPEPMVPCKKETYPIAYELFEAAIEDADECIRILRFPEFLSSLSGQSIAALFASQSSVEMNLMLINRGRSYQYLEEYELAMNDFRALCSRKRMGSPLTWHQSPTLHDATMECLNTATLIKLRDKVPRPHYTKEELEKFEKEVGLGLYSAEKYLCGFCHAKKSNKVTLRLCSRCKNAWFCSQECLKKAWKTGHKAKCKPFKGHALPISKEQVANIVREVKETGFSGLESTDKCWIICQDENGEFFDSLSDADIGITKLSNDIL